jgi:hypothetical protein
VAMKVVRAIAHDQGHKQTLRPSAGRSPGALINAIREVLHAEMMRVEVGGTQQPGCWRGAYEKRIGYQCG